MATFPTLAPTDVGLKVTVCVQLAAAVRTFGNVVPQVPPALTNWPLSAPVMVIPLMLRSASPVLVMVIVCATDVVFTRRDPKARVAGDTAMLGLTPVPPRATVAVGVSGSFVAISKAAVLAPTEVGEKVIFCVQLAAGARVVPHVVVPLANWFAWPVALVIVIPFMLSVWVPVLEMVIA